MNAKRMGIVLLVLVAGATWLLVPASTYAAPSNQRDQHSGWHPHGDVVVLNGLVAATAAVTIQRPARVREQLRNGKSIEQIAQAAGKSSVDVLARFDTGVDTAMARAVENGRLPQSVADSRAAWFKQSARLQIDQPGFKPAFPGLHELHVVMISAAVEVSGIPRAGVRAQLETCKTISDVVATRGKSGADVANGAMMHLDKHLQENVANGKLITAQRDEWRAALQSTTLNMTTTPGLHVASKACAK